MKPKQRDAVRDKALGIFEVIETRYKPPHPTMMYGEDGWWALLDNDELWFMVGREDPHMAVAINVITDDIVLKGTTAEEFIKA